MPLKTLPPKPQISIIKREAKLLLREWCNEPAPVLQRLKPHHDFDLEKPPEPKLTRAQFIIAREYGFSSWPKLFQRVQELNPNKDIIHERFLTAAIDPTPNNRAWKMLEENSWLRNYSLEARMVCGDESVLEEYNSDNINELTETLNWLPLMLVTFSSAATFGYVEEATLANMAKKLIEKSADVLGTIDEKFVNEITPFSALYGAVGVNDYPLVTRVLMDAGADPIDGETLYHGPQYGHMKSLNVLSEYDIDVAKKQKPWNNTPIFFQMGIDPKWGYYEKTKLGIKWLLDHGADPNIKAESSQDNALHSAFKFMQPDEVIDMLINADADPLSTNRDGVNCIELAVRYGRKDIAKKLAEKAGIKYEPEPMDELMSLCFEGNTEAVQKFLNQHPKLKDNLRPHDHRLLMDAAVQGKAEVVECLLIAGAHPEQRGEYGGTPLHHATWRGHAETVRALLKTGKALDAIDDEFGWNPVGWLAHGSVHCQVENSDHIATAKLLIDAGVDLNFQAPNKAYPTSMASEEVKQALKKAGALE